MPIPTKWTQLFNRLQANIQYLVGKINDIDSSGSSFTIDSALSTTSENPVQNKVIASRINTINTTLGYKAEGQTTQNSTAIGYDTTAGSGSIVIGAQSFQSLASNNITLGNNIQVGDYSTDNKFIVGDQQGNGDYYEMLNLQTGLIPDARISSNIARTSQIPPQEIFVATYNTTSYADILSAYYANKTILCQYNFSSVTIYYGVLSSYQISSSTSYFLFNIYDGTDESRKTLYIDSNNTWSIIDNGAFGDFANKDMCTTTPTTTSTASSDKPAVVVENWRSSFGTRYNWYTVYSDGRCEQGGVHNVSDTSGISSISFFKSMSSVSDIVVQFGVNDAVTSTSNVGSRSVARYCGAITEITSSNNKYVSFKCQTSSNSGAQYMWRADGWI